MNQRSQAAIGGPSGPAGAGGPAGTVGPGETVYDVQGPPRAPLLVLLGSLGTTRAVWDRQVPVLRGWFRVLRVEHPGHGGQPVPAAPGSVEALGAPVLSLLDQMGEEHFHVAGLSLGGLVAMWLAAQAPARAQGVALCCTRPRFEPADAYLQRAGEARAGGMAPLVDASLSRWFSEEFLEREPGVRGQYAAMLSGVGPEGYAFCCEAIAGTDMSGALAAIEAPTLVLSAAHDPVVPPEVSAAMMAALPRGTLHVLPSGRHLANVEQPTAFNEALLGHLAGSQAERGRHERRAVLGAAHVERAESNATALTAGFQAMLARWPWGDIWARPGLDRPTRRLLTIAMMVALGRPEELAMHLKAALEDGVSEGTLEEVLLQAAVYAGVPAANSAFAIADRVWHEFTASHPGEEGGATTP